MEMGKMPVHVHTDPRASAFFDKAAAGDEQGFNIRPFNVRSDRISEDGFQGFTVFAVHVLNSTTQQSHVKGHICGHSHSVFVVYAQTQRLCGQHHV